MNEQLQTPTFVPMADDGEHDIVTALGLANFTCGEWRGGNPDDPSYSIHLEAAEAAEQVVRDFIHGIQDQLQALREENERFRVNPEHQFKTVHQDLCDTLGVQPGGSVIGAVDALTGKLATKTAQLKRANEVLEELVTVADLRGDADLPHPADDPKTWTARMQTAWDEARELVEQNQGTAEPEVKGNTKEELMVALAQRLGRNLSAWTADGHPITPDHYLAAMREEP